MYRHSLLSLCNILEESFTASVLNVQESSKQQEYFFASVFNVKESSKKEGGGVCLSFRHHKKGGGYFTAYAVDVKESSKR